MTTENIRAAYIEKLRVLSSKLTDLHDEIRDIWCDMSDEKIITDTEDSKLFNIFSILHDDVISEIDDLIVDMEPEYYAPYRVRIECGHAVYEDIEE